ncbi:MAG: ribosome-associated translation inhibitor RaiA [Candidatus Colwellbacteria bacterium]|nr:ribosome-associated translation inhibitor RaiA [Candidatus Colwellbacteria bacterium]
MKVNIKTKNFELTEAIREYIETKMEHLNKLTSDWSIEGSAELDFEVAKETQHHNKGDVYYAEANLKVPGKLIRAEKNSDDLHAAIDSVKDILAEQIKEYKEKLSERE